MIRAQEQDREEIAQARADWENEQKKIPAGKLGCVVKLGMCIYKQEYRS